MARLAASRAKAKAKAEVEADLGNDETNANAEQDVFEDGKMHFNVSSML